jgi:hypothetical protein
MMRQVLIKEDHPGGADGLRLRFTHQDRIRYLVISGVAAIVLLIARLLQPSPNGVGTHTQVGLPPCPFLHFTGIPCLSCGLTTSVSHSARLHFYEALITQPFGLIVFFGAVLSIPLSLYFIQRRIPWSRLNEWRGWNFAMYTLLALFLLSWLYKIAAMKGLFALG